MIFIQDSGSVFEAPLETVWKLAEDHVEHGNKIHPDTRNNKAEIIDFIKPIKMHITIMIIIKIRPIFKWC